MKKINIGVIFLFVQLIALIALLFIDWHLKNKDLSAVLGILFLCNFFIAFSIDQKKIILFAFASWLLIFSLLSYNPYTIFLMENMSVIKKSDEIYLIEMSNGQVVAVIKEENAWRCLGKEYSNKTFCKKITSLIEGELKAKSPISPS